MSETLIYFYVKFCFKYVIHRSGGLIPTFNMLQGIGFTYRNVLITAVTRETIEIRRVWSEEHRYVSTTKYKENLQGSFNKSLENPKDGAHSIENGLVLVSIITD